MSTAVATQEKQVAAQPPRKQFKDHVSSEQFQSQLKTILPEHCTPERFTRVLLTATMKNPLLLECTQESMFKGILDAAGAGIEIDGRRAHLIPYKNNNKRCYEAQLIIDYKGIAELIMRSGTVSYIHADVVCENDVFEYDRGQVKVHKIDLKQPRGKMYAAYCIIKMKDGGEKADVMSREDIDRVRSRSRAGNNGPWVTDFDEMAKKTVFRRASKWVTLSPEIRSVVESDDVDDAPLNVTPSGGPGGFAGLIGAALPERASTETTASEVHEEPTGAPAQPARTYTAEERAKITDDLKNAMLDAKVDEKSLFAVAKTEKLVPEGVDELFALPTDSLVRLAAILPTLGK